MIFGMISSEGRAFQMTFLVFSRTVYVNAGRRRFSPPIPFSITLPGIFAGMTNSSKKKFASPGERRVTLKTVAAHLGLTPGTVSAALNNSAGCTLHSRAH